MKALLLVNLGTPDDPGTKAVRRYLREFLMDPYVIDIPLVLRWLLVHGIILRTRPAKSAALYQKIWTSRGSPLLFHTEDLTVKVQNLLGPDVPVEFGKRYGKPSIESALLKLKNRGATEITVLPLYPQYSLAATESSIAWCRKIAAQIGLPNGLKFVEDFFDHEGFISAFAATTQQWIDERKPDFVLFSFHGLPERQVKKTEIEKGYCQINAKCCATVNASNRKCYRAQCFQTARLMAAKLNLRPDQFSVAFQSRLGRTPWIQPFSDRLYEELPKRGVKRLLVVSPSFVADCLETLEEIAIRGREQFRAAGGEELWLVPSLNSSDAWAQVVAELFNSSRS